MKLYMKLNYFLVIILVVSTTSLFFLSSTLPPVVTYDINPLYIDSVLPPNSISTSHGGNKKEDWMSRMPTQQSQNYYKHLRNTTQSESLITYIAHSGLGHRLHRMSSVFHAAKILNQSHFESTWGLNCGKDEYGHLDIFDLLFGKGPIVVDSDEDLYVERYKQQRQGYTRQGKIFQSFKRVLETSFPSVKAKNKTIIINDVAGYDPMKYCDLFNVSLKELLIDKFISMKELFLDKFISDVLFYRQLRSLFRFNHRVQSFADEHRFSERIVLGLHIRDGNGEKFDFEQKKRKIQGIDAWIICVAKTLQDLILKIQSARDNYVTEKKTKKRTTLPPLIFVGTDDATLIDKLANATRPYGIPIITYPQQRLKPGVGPSYSYRWNTAEDCRDSWVDQFIDASLLSIADVVIAGRYSTFTQSMPLIEVLSDSVLTRMGQHRAEVTLKNQTITASTYTDESVRFANRLFCEFGKNGTEMGCYDDYFDWMLGENQLHLSSLSSSDNTRTKIVKQHKKEVLLPCELNA